MAHQWYYAKDNQQRGPVDEEAFRRLLQAGEVRSEDLVWREGMSTWVAAGRVEELRDAIAPPVAEQVEVQPIQPNPYAQPPGGYPTRALGYSMAPPKTWLAESIICTLCCCMPFGVVGIVYASQVSSKWSTGDTGGAMAASNSAKTWVTVAFVVGLITNALAFFGGLLGG